MGVLGQECIVVASVQGVTVWFSNPVAVQVCMCCQRVLVPATIGSYIIASIPPWSVCVHRQTAWGGQHAWRHHARTLEVQCFWSDPCRCLHWSSSSPDHSVDHHCSCRTPHQLLHHHEISHSLAQHWHLPPAVNTQSQSIWLSGLMHAFCLYTCNVAQNYIRKLFCLKLSDFFLQSGRSNLQHHTACKSWALSQCLHRCRAYLDRYIGWGMVSYFWAKVNASNLSWQSQWQNPFATVQQIQMWDIGNKSRVSHQCSIREPGKSKCRSLSCLSRPGMIVCYTVHKAKLIKSSIH